MIAPWTHRDADATPIPPPRVTIWEADGQPVPRVGYGAPIATRLRAAGFAVDVVPLLERTPTPDELGADLHVLSGGATPARAQVPWMRATRRAVQGVVERALAGNARVVGICLGAQMLASTLAGDAVVRSSPAGMEAGLRVVHSTRPDGTRWVVPEFHHHELDPDRLVGAGATITVSNEHTEVQGFEAGEGVTGYQFHPELDPAAMTALLRTHAPLLHATGSSLSASLRSVAAHRVSWDPGTFDQLVTARLQGGALARAA